MIQDTRKPAIDFAPYINEHAEGFTRREWVLQAINDWLVQPDGSRYFLLTGEPGSGKTAIASRLVQFSQGAVSPASSLPSLMPRFLSAFYFCSARDSRWVNPFVFAESLALQLAERYPAYAKILAGVSGDRQIHIEVQQRVEQGQAVGVVIHRLNVSGSTPEDAFNRLVREPLEALFQDGFDQQIIVLIDALDEALAYSGSRTIIALLSLLQELPSAVRFLLTSRQDARIVNAFFDADELALSAASYEQRNQEDIRQYVKERFGNDERLATKASELDATFFSEKVVETIVRKAEGNFLYTRFLLNAIADGKRSLLDLEGLPEGLDGLYYVSLKRVIQLGKGEWHSEYAPLIGMLSAVLESPTFAQLQSFTKQSTTVLLKQLDDLGQFVEEVKFPNREESYYRLYHQSFIDFLRRQSISLRKKELRNEFYLPGDEWHKALADWCGGDVANLWKDTMRNPGEQGRRMYARQFYINHLYQAYEWDRLFHVLDEGAYGRAKLQYDPSTNAFAQDLDLGRQAASWEGWTLEEGIALLPRLWQYTLLRCSLTSQADRYHPRAFQLLVLLKRKQEAVGLAELLTDPANKVQALLEIGWQLWKQPDHTKEGLLLFLRAEEVAHAIENNFQRAEVLANLANSLSQAQQWEQAQAIWKQVPAIIDTIERRSQRANASATLATSLAEAQQWEQARAIIDTIEDRERRAYALAALATSLAETQQWAQAHAVIDTIEDRYQQVRALAAQATSLAKAQQWEQAHVIWKQMPAVIDAIDASRIDLRAGALTVLITSLAKAQQWEQAQAIINTIESVSHQEEGLTALAIALAQAQKWEQAQAVIDTIENGYQCVRALAELAFSLAEAQQWEQMQAVWKQAQVVWKQARIPTHPIVHSSGWNVEELVLLAIILAQNQQWEQAQAVWKQAKAVINTLESDGQAEALVALVRALAEAQQWEQARAVSDAVEDRYWRVRALVTLAISLSQTQQWEQAQAIWKQAQAVIDAIEDNFHRAEMLVILASDLAEAQQWEQAQADWDQAQALIEHIEDSYKHERTLAILAISLAKAQRWEQAQAVIDTMKDSNQQGWALTALVASLVEAQRWEQARAVSDTIEGSGWQAEALVSLAVASNAQQWEQAQAVWEQAQALIDTLEEDDVHRNEVLRTIAMLYAQDQQWEQAQAIIDTMDETTQEVWGSVPLATALAEAQQWEQAQTVIDRIENNHRRGEALVALATARARARQWKQAQTVIALIENKTQQAWASWNLATEVADTGGDESLLDTLHRSWRLVDAREDALDLFSMAIHFIPRSPEIGFALHEAFTWVDSFLEGE